MQKGYRTEAMVTMQQKSKAHRTGSGRWEEGPGSAITVGRRSNKGGLKTPIGRCDHRPNLLLHRIVETCFGNHSH